MTVTPKLTLNDIMNEATEGNELCLDIDNVSSEKNTLQDDEIDSLCKEYLELKAQEKYLKSRMSLIKEDLLELKQYSTGNYSIKVSETQSFRLKGLKIFESAGYTKESLLKEGLGGISTTFKLNVKKADS